MRLKKELLFFLAIIVFTFVGIVAQTMAATVPTPPPIPPTPNFSFASQRIIVKFKPLVPSAIHNIVNQSLGGKIQEKLFAQRTFIIGVPTGQELAFVDNYQKNVFVEYAEPDFEAQAEVVPNDPLLTNQWAQDKINTPEAWPVASGGGVDIAILDGGIANNHPDLHSKVLAWQNFTSTASQYDHSGHGSHVAGIAAAVSNNATGVTGTGYNARLLSVKVLDDKGAGFYSWIINGIYWAVDNGAEIINMSLSGTSASTAMKQAIDYATSKGVLVVVAAGNQNRNAPVYPAYYDNVIAVAATDVNDIKASFSNYGTWVDLAAPGVSILSTTPNNAYTYYSGTSMAAPHVSGVLALLKSYYPDWSAQQLRDKIQQTADPIAGTGVLWTFGRVNVARAMDLATSVVAPSPTPTPTPTVTPNPTPVVTASPLPTTHPTVLPTPTSLPASQPTTTPRPSGTPKPWFCAYFPTHKFCQ